MENYQDLLNLFLDNIRKVFYPEEWIDLDLSLSKTEIFSLFILDQYGEMTMSQIADHTHVSMSTATGIIDRLVKKHYLQRERSESDRRIVVIQMTPKGKSFIDEFKNTIMVYIQQIDEVLTDEERNVLYQVFMKVVQIMNRDPKEQIEPQEQQKKVRKIEIE